jgi:hypothetical protein
LLLYGVAPLDCLHIKICLTLDDYSKESPGFTFLKKILHSLNV